jgi:rSAM/selenodomain-associated transferase 1
MRRSVILFLRRPEYGRGKRRLAAAIGDAAAVGFERRMLNLLLRRLGRDRRWRLCLAVTPDRARLSLRLAAAPQGRGDLGRRMRRALRAAGPGPAVLVGADIPALGAAQIAAAFRLLGRHDLVFGPARDGGFWLVGARHPAAMPDFGTVRWSSPHALADTLANLPKRLSVGCAETLADVDDGPGYASTRSSRRLIRSMSPATRSMRRETLA